MLILVTGLNPSDFEKKTLIREKVASLPLSTSSIHTVTFIDRQWVINILGVLDHYDYILVCHPNLVKYLYENNDPKNEWQKKLHGWWKRLTDGPVKFYSTQPKSWELDVSIFFNQLTNRVQLEEMISHDGSRGTSRSIG